MYNRTLWVDHVKDESGNVLQQGTPIDQEHLNNIEDGISELAQRMDAIGTALIQIPSARMRGDVNGDGLINSADLMLLKMHIAGTQILTGASLQAADINGDGVVNEDDVSLCKKIIFNDLEPTPMTAGNGGWDAVSNPTTDYIYYIDMPIDGLTATNDVLCLTMSDSILTNISENVDVFAQKIRLYAKTIPKTVFNILVLIKALGSGAGVLSSVKKQIDSVAAHTHTKSDITDFTHTHDDLYYKKAETDEKAGTVLYEAPAGSTGLYCDGNTTATDVNSATLSDPNGGYKRLKIYASSVYGLACAEMPIDRTHSATNPYGNRIGGIIFPSGDHSNGATLNYLTKIHWCVKFTENVGWTFQVTDSGWVNLGTGAVSQADYTDNKSVAATNAAPTWNQRHNSGYSVYKIVGYTV